MNIQQALANYKELQELIEEIVEYLIKIEYIPSRYEGRVFIYDMTSIDINLLIFDKDMYDYEIVRVLIDDLVYDTWREYFDRRVNKLK